MANYPNSLYSHTTIVDGSDYPLATHINTPAGEIVAIETELGTNPKSISDAVSPSSTPTSVANYLDMVATAIKRLGAVTNWYDVANAKEVVGIMVFGSATNCSTGDAKAFFRVPSKLNGWNLVAVAMNCYTAGTTGTMDVQIRNKTDSQDMLSTKLTIDSAETDTLTAATAAVINTTYDDVATGDLIAIDVDAVHTTPALGLFVELQFQLP